jgi:hypothetical protein
MSELPDVFVEALGVYVGPASYDEVIEALTSVPPTSVLIAWIETVGVSECKQGRVEHYAAYADEDEDHEDPLDLFFLVSGRGSEGLRVGVMWRDVPFVFHLHRSPWFRAERFSGGVRLHPYEGATITIAVWHSIQHVTDDGDVVPGFGPFTASLEDEDEEEDR